MRFQSTVTIVVTMGIAGFLAIANEVGVTAQENQLQPRQINPNGNVPASSQQPPAAQATTRQSADVANRPAWVNTPLPRDQQAYLDQVLAYWEQTSTKVKRYQCKFTRWQYNPDLCAHRDPATGKLSAFMVARGEIRYSSPDHGMYEVDEVWHFNRPKTENGKPDYRRRENAEERERWICDGRSIYEFDFVNKNLNDMELPPEMQGEGLKNSPLPFVFGARAADLKSRYWIRNITPPNAPESEFWLEAVPKRREDAGSYQKVEIVLSKDPFLPKSLHIYASNYDPRKGNEGSSVFVFEDRKINDKLGMILDWANHFLRPKTPVGWDRKPIKIYSEANQAQLPNQAPGRGAALPRQRQ